MQREIRKTSSEFWVDILRDYQTVQGPGLYTIAELAAWASDTGRWTLARGRTIRLASLEARKALEGVVQRDPQGRRYRRFLQAKIEQKFLWGDVHQAPLEFVREAYRQLFEQDRQNIRTHMESLASYNECILPQWGDMSPIEAPAFAKAIVETQSHAQKEVA